MSLMLTFGLLIPHLFIQFINTRILLKQIDQYVLMNSIVYWPPPCILKEAFSLRKETRREQEGPPRWGWLIQVGHWRKGLGPIRWQRQNSKRRRRTWLPAISQLSIHEALRRSCPTCNYRCIVCIIRPWYVHSREVDRRRCTRTISRNLAATPKSRILRWP